MANKPVRRPKTPSRAEVIECILDQVREGISVTKSCKAMKVKPGNFLEWVAKDVADLGERYARARNIGYDVRFEELNEIVSNSKHDVIELDGRKVLNSVRIARDRLIHDNAKWQLAKMMPKKYGEKTSVEISGKLDINQLTDADLVKIAAGEE